MKCVPPKNGSRRGPKQPDGLQESNTTAQARETGKGRHPPGQPKATAKDPQLGQPGRRRGRSQIPAVLDESRRESVRRVEGTLTGPYDEEASAKENEVASEKAGAAEEPGPETPTAIGSS